MNYLAHALLSQPGDLPLLGNLAGDHVKGPLPQLALHPGIALGVRRHRRVDRLCDAHRVTRELRSRFPGGQRRYAGILLDVLFDHQLARQWQQYCTTPLPRFRAEVYGAIHAHRSRLPRAFASVAPRWAEQDWLRAYETHEGVVAVLERVGGRLRRPLPLAALLATAEQERSSVEDGFAVLFTDLQRALGATRRPDLLIDAAHPQATDYPGARNDTDR